MLLSYEQLIRLTRELRTTPVLSVYIDGAAPDPAARADRKSTRLNSSH